MKIAYIDLNEDSHVEDYSFSPSRYGGGAVFARAGLELLNHSDNIFHLFSSSESFQRVKDKEARCISLSSEQRQKLRNEESVLDVLGDISKQYDLFIHHFCGRRLNLDGLKAKEIVWAVGLREVSHPKTENLILYNEFQKTSIYPETKIFKAKIGKSVPNFRHNNKQDFIFQCTRHVPEFGSIQVAEQCLKHGIKCVFAGPIGPNYPLLKYIDNSNIFYLGEVEESVKISYLRNARLSTYMHYWETPFNLSAIESLGQGTPIMATRTGFWTSLVKENINGFFFNGNNFLDIWEKSKKINQRDCWDTANEYSLEIMLREFTEVFQKVYESI